VIVGVAEGKGDGGNGVKVGEITIVGVTETEVVGNGEREAEGKGVARGVSPETHAANPRPMPRLMPRLLRMIVKRDF
jgi:hypothetical protein